MGHMAASSVRLLEAERAFDPTRRAELLEEAAQHLHAVLAVQGGVGVPDAVLAKAHAGLGEVALARERYREAIRAYDEALFYIPGKASADVLSGLGFAYLRSGIPDSAALHLERAVALDSTDAETLTNLGRAYQALGFEDQALALYERARRADPRAPLPSYNLGVTLARRGDHATAVGHLERAATQETNDPRALIQLASSYRELGRLDDALEAAQRSVKIAPDNADAATNLGLILLDLGDRKGASDAFLRATELDPYRPETLVALGDLRRQAGRNVAAMDDYRAALLVRPDDAMTHLNLGVLLLQDGPGGISTGGTRALARAPRDGDGALQSGPPGDARPQARGGGSTLSQSGGARFGPCEGLVPARCGPGAGRTPRGRARGA